MPKGRLSHDVGENLIPELAAHSTLSNTCKPKDSSTICQPFTGSISKIRLMSNGCTFIHHPTSNTLKGQDIFHSPLNVVDQREGVFRWNGISCQTHAVTQFVANEWLRSVEEYGDEEFIPVDSMRHRTVVAVYYLDDHEFFHEMHPPVVIALGSKIPLSVAAYWLKSRTEPLLKFQDTYDASNTYR